MGLEEEELEVKCRSHHIMPRICSINMHMDVSLDHLAEVVFIRILHYNVPLFSTFHTVLFGWKSLYAAILKKWGVMLHLFAGRVSTLFIWNSAWEMYVGRFLMTLNFIHRYDYLDCLLLLVLLLVPWFLSLGIRQFSSKFSDVVV